jgi:hypothetical protein
MNIFKNIMVNKQPYASIMFLFLLIMTASTPVVLDSSTRLDVATFSQMEAGQPLPSDWEKMTFRGYKPTEYSLVELDGKVVAKAVSEQSSSGLIRRIDVDLAEYPILEWSWLVQNIYEKGDVTQKSGDDYPTRIYVIFDYDLKNLSWFQRNLIRGLRVFYGEVPTRAINYIYESKAEVGTIVPNPYSDLVKMVVVDSGSENLGSWQYYTRNLLDDYREIFGEEPPKIAAIAIMTDSDDTKESATSYFGDISFTRTSISN